MRKIFVATVLLGVVLAALTAQPAQALAPAPLPPPPEVFGKSYVFAHAEIALPKPCRDKSGKLICASKADRRVYAVKNGRVVDSAKARFGGIASDGSGPWFTRESKHFKVNWKSPARVSTLYDVWMYDVLNFSGGQHIHYSEEFHRHGFRYGSHGCVGLANRTFSKWLYNWSPVGTRIIVTRK